MRKKKLHSRKVITILITFVMVATLSGCDLSNSPYHEDPFAGAQTQYEVGYEKGWQACLEENGTYDEGWQDYINEYGAYEENYEDGYNQALHDVASELYDYNFPYLVGFNDGVALNPYTDISGTWLNEQGVIDAGQYYDGYCEGYDTLVDMTTGDNEIPMVKVQSSFINSVGYIFDKQILMIDMNEDDFYFYSDVPQDIFIGLISAESPGSYFNQNVKGIYEYTKVEQ